MNLKINGKEYKESVGFLLWLFICSIPLCLMYWIYSKMISIVNLVVERVEFTEKKNIIDYLVAYPLYYFIGVVLAIIIIINPKAKDWGKRN